ncbi:MAG: uracil-DNA glycosylase [Candidatus Woesearchaeota archaeon]
MSLDLIKLDLLENLHDDLRKNAKNLVFGKGNKDADIMFIGEAPGAKEDALGLPFVGASGKELDKLLKTINLSLEDVYIANILKYRPPNNRNPNINEIKAHTPYLVRQIKSIKPRVICTLGNFSTKFILSGFNIKGMKNVDGISNLHGKIKSIEVEGEEFYVLPIYHPAAMLYNPNIRKFMVEDFVVLKDFLNRL